MDKEEHFETTSEGWHPLARVLGVSHPFFDSVLHWEGYDNSSNIYVVAGETLSIIDPGNDYMALADLFRRGFRPSDVRKIVLTHGHVEHVMGTFELLRYPVEPGTGALEVIFHESGPAGFREMLGEAAKECPRSLTLTEVRGGETLDLGDVPVEVIHTPGHTMDSLCLYHSPTRSLFTGDTVLPFAVASPDPSAGGRAEYHLFVIKQLMKRQTDVLLPGHGKPVAAETKRVLAGSYAGIVKKMVGLETPWIEGAAMLAQKGYLEESLFCCEKERESCPENTKALALKATCLSDLGRFSEAIEAFEQLRVAGDNPLFALLGNGVALMGLGRYGECLASFEKILAEKPDFREALMYKGMALYLSGRVDEAMQIHPFEKEFVERFKDSLEKRMSRAGRSPGHGG